MFRLIQFAAVISGLLLAAMVCAMAPADSKRIRSPLAPTAEALEAGKALFDSDCASCHGEDGKSQTQLARRLPVRPANLSRHSLDALTDGEIYWTIVHGSGEQMPAFDSKLSEPQRWQIVFHVRELRARQRAVEVSDLGPYRWSVPAGFPLPNVPKDNPMTEAKVELGRHLFYDTRLSLNRKQSCASCHQQEYAFTDGRGRGIGSTGQVHPRGPMSLANVAYSPTLTWANPNLRTLEAQALIPLFGEDPVELGMSGKEAELLRRLKAEPRYRKLFAAAFPEAASAFSVGNLTKAIASFERTILSGDSPYDAYRTGTDANAISDAAKRGEALFFSERADCFHCHGGINFTGPIDYYTKIFPEAEFHNTALYNLSGPHSYPQDNLGLYVFTRAPGDVGKFKAPTLRNVALTAPYMHDGSIRTLAEVIEHYAAGGRKISSGPFSGDGSKNPNRSEFVQPLDLTEQDKRDLLEFLKSLTDKTLTTDKRLSNPWREP